MGDTHRQNSIFYDASADSKCTCKFYQPPILMQKKLKLFVAIKVTNRQIVFIYVKNKVIRPNFQ